VNPYRCRDHYRNVDKERFFDSDGDGGPDSDSFEIGKKAATNHLNPSYSQNVDLLAALGVNLWKSGMVRIGTSH
jgi:hypothetical protein